MTPRVGGDRKTNCDTKILPKAVDGNVTLRHHLCLVAMLPRVSGDFRSDVVTTVVDMRLDLFCEALERESRKTQINVKGHMTAQG